MQSRSVLLATVVLAVSAGGALAAGDDWRRKQIELHDSQQDRSIEAGRYQGELTRREYRELLAERQRIEAMERQAKSDGYVSKREFREIRSAQDSAGRHISSEAHDGQKSWWRRFLYLNRY